MSSWNRGRVSVGLPFDHADFLTEIVHGTNGCCEHHRVAKLKKKKLRAGVIGDQDWRLSRQVCRCFYSLTASLIFITGDRLGSHEKCLTLRTR